MTLPLTEQDIDRLAGQGVRSLSPQDFNHLLAQAKLAIEIVGSLEAKAKNNEAMIAEAAELNEVAKDLDSQ